MSPNLDGGATFVDQTTGWMLALGERFGVPKNVLGYVAAMNFSSKIIGQLCALKETGQLDKKDLAITGAAKILEKTVIGFSKETLGMKNAKFLGAVTGQGFESAGAFINGSTKRVPIK
jgi:hypothetical protein